MAFWPRDERTETQKPSMRRKATSTDGKLGYPYLEPGLIGAATLSNNSLDWIFLSNWQSVGDDVVERRLKFGKHVEVFPPTRATPTKLERMTLKRRTEEGTNFLRTYLPDVDVSAELLQEQLSEEVALTRRLERFDPYAGNALDTFKLRNEFLESYLLFPSGETNCDLNSCRIDFSDPTRVLFEPTARPIYSFPTPIQHLLMSPNPLANNHLAVRTLGCVNVFSIKQIDDSMRLAVFDVVDLFRSDFGDETVVDMKFPSSPSNILTLGKKGSLFDCNFEHGRKKVTAIHQTEETSRQNSLDFWRLSLDTNIHNSFILSTNAVFQVDRRTRFATNIFRLFDEKHLLTSIEDVSRANCLQLCSTKDILCLDTRYPGKPLLAYAHGREFDQYLSTTTASYPGQNPLTFLSCRNNGLVTMYEVSPSNESLIQLVQPPHMLSSSKSLYEKHVGQRFLADGIGMGIVRLSERGGLTYRVIKPASIGADRYLIVQKSEDMVKLDASTPETRETRPVLGGINYTESDLRDQYNALFNRHFQEKLENEEHSSESLERMLDFFPYCMRNNELPLEHPLTTYDIAFRAGSEPRRTSRADFLVDGIVNSSRAYEALTAGRLSPHLVKAPWHCSIASTLRRLDREFRPDPQQMMDYLEQFKLVGENVPEHVRQLERIASQQLTLDLTLSCDIFSETMFSKTNEIDKTLETMTGALSLGSEPAPVKFGYLRPVPNQPTGQNFEDTDDQELEIPMGVQLLLKEWDSGNPEEYVYQDPYTAETFSSHLKFSDSQLADSVDQSQRPPSILPSSVIPPLISEKAARIVHSQELTTWSQHGGESQGQVVSSQDFAISTQILPGPFGGRPNAKKKPAKKRLGGF